MELVLEPRSLNVLIVIRASRSSFPAMPGSQPHPTTQSESPPRAVLLRLPCTRGAPHTGGGNGECCRHQDEGSNICRQQDSRGYGEVEVVTVPYSLLRITRPVALDERGAAAT